MPAPLVSATSSSILLNLWKDLSNLMDRRERYKGSFTDVTRAWFHEASAGFRSQRRSEEAMKLARRLGAFVTIACALSASSSAGPGKPAAPVFGTELTLVLLPVFVADGEGRAMRGLSAEDFELYEDGKRAELVSFRYVDTTSPDEQET